MARNVTLSVAVERDTAERLVDLSLSKEQSVSTIIRDAILDMLKSQTQKAGTSNEQV
jgi:hypothetical protein